MKSFEEHLRGAKAHNREDKIWLVTCFSGKMAKLCAKYGFPDDEDNVPQALSVYFQQFAGAKWNLMAATAVIAIVPVVVIFLIFQKSLMKGLTEGAIKG